MIVSFTSRATPLAPVAVAALGPRVATLHARLRSFTDAQLLRFSGVTTGEATVVLGPSDALPWFDGALYLGAQGSLLVPTWAEPSVHPSLLERALRQAFSSVPKGPLALLFDSLTSAPRVVPLAGALPLLRERLA